MFQYPICRSTIECLCKISFKFRKTSVTLHHNAGRLSHDGVLGVWQKRPASAHFNVDAYGTVAQYVNASEYAWAVGSYSGNCSTISIEMCNLTLSPYWEVSETTWKAAARLAGWLFAHVIKARPTEHNRRRHSNWSSTACPGPFIDKNWSKIIVETQKWYDHFTSSPGTSERPPVTTGKKSNAEIAAEVWLGKWGNGDDRIRRLKAAGYDPKIVQIYVNRGAPKPSSRKSIGVLAEEVIAGKWGNGEDRIRRLSQAGYNAKEVQAEVNRRLL